MLEKGGNNTLEYDCAVFLCFISPKVFLPAYDTQLFVPLIRAHLQVERGWKVLERRENNTLENDSCHIIADPNESC